LILKTGSSLRVTKPPDLAMKMLPEKHYFAHYPEKTLDLDQRPKFGGPSPNYNPMRHSLKKDRSQIHSKSQSNANSKQNNQPYT